MTYNNVERNNMKTQEYLDKYQQAKELYLQNNLSLTQISKQLHMDRGILAKNLKADGVIVHNYQNEPRMNQFFFDVIDSEEKAYWLGFLYADGAIGSFNNGIEVSLKSSDIDHLYKLANSLGFVDKHIYQDEVRCRLNFNNKRIHSKLIELGCTPRKSLTLTFPSSTQVPSYLIRHFVRGYIDGDGSVMIGKNHKGERVKPRLSILGTKDFLTSLVDSMGWKLNHISHPSGAYQIEWGGNYVYSYLENIYQNANIYLDRKYQRFLYLQNLFADNKLQD